MIGEGLATSAWRKCGDIWMLISQGNILASLNKKDGLWSVFVPFAVSGVKQPTPSLQAAMIRAETYVDEHEKVNK